MLTRLALLMIAIPLADLVLLMLLARLTGFWTTIGLIVLTGVLGAWAARNQWRWLLRRTRMRIGQQEIPAEVVTDGLLILVGACLLVTPGILTDIAGLTLLVPGARRWYRKVAAEWLRSRLWTMSSAGVPGDGEVLEGTAVEVTGRDRGPAGESGNP